MYVQDEEARLATYCKVKKRNQKKDWQIELEINIEVFGPPYGR